MAVRTIIRHPDARLRLRAHAVESVTPEIRALADDMAETMYASKGVGLAAPQIGVSLRMFVVDINATHDERPSDLRVCINPELTLSDARAISVEGCLSFPGVLETIERSRIVTVRATDLDGKPIVFLAEGMLAVVVQHENDHLDGALLIDHISLLRRRLIERAMRKRN
jgi:peptide deformylase